MLSKVQQTSPEVAASAVLADRVTKVFRSGRIEVQALRAASLSVAPGEFVAIMGASGSGKSTLLNLVAGLDLPTSGTIHVHGLCVSTMSDDEATTFRRRHIGFVYQNFNLLTDLTIEQNIGVPLMLDGCSASDIRARVARMLEQVELYDRRTHMPNEVSGGELQRAAIARALVADPAIVLADEPTGNLDSATGERVLLDMRRAVDEMGRTIVLVTHDSRAAAYADRIARLRDGRFVD